MSFRVPLQASIITRVEYIDLYRTKALSNDFLGYSGDGAECFDVDECAEGTDKCSNSECSNSPGSYTCQCLQGNELTFLSDFVNRGITEKYSIITGYGKRGNDTHACIDNDECSDLKHGCSEKATCTNTESSFTCTCYKGPCSVCSFLK